MTLKEYLYINRMSVRQFGALVGVSGQAVWNWREGHRIPSRKSMEQIVAATGAEVTPNDFFETTAP